MNKGEIESKYFDSSQFADLAPEFGKLYREEYGIDKLDMLRRVFANLAKDNGQNSHKKYLLDIALTMTEPEIKALVADAELARTIDDQQDANELRQDHKWLSRVADVSGLKHSSLVATAEKGLVEKGLLSGRRMSDGSGTDFMMHRGRLTTMGNELYELMILDDDPVAAE